tara:strand:- start:387 stop:905 length:519 start_codon:yes stop_codon:yes gene_type:complete
MKKKILFFSVILSTLFIFFILFKGLYNQNYYVPKTITKSLISFKAEDFFTKEKLNSDQFILDNKYIIINIWASWCVPCLKEHKYLMSLKKNNNFKLIGLNYKDKENNAKQFIAKNGNPYELILSDKNGTIAIELGAFGVPETFVIHEKKIIKKYIGPLDEKNIFEILRITKK